MGFHPLGPRVDIRLKPVWTQGWACDSSCLVGISFRTFAGIIRKGDLFSNSIAKLVGNESASAICIITKETFLRMKPKGEKQRQATSDDLQVKFALASSSRTGESHRH